MNYKQEWPIGKKIEKYPSLAGSHPAEVIGYRVERNLNTGESTPIIRVKVTRPDGNHEEGFAASFGHLFD